MYKVYGDRLCDKTMPDLLQDLVKNNLHGRKSGQGLYLYQPGVKGGERDLNPKFAELTKKLCDTTKRSFNSRDNPMENRLKIS